MSRTQDGTLGDDAGADKTALTGHLGQVWCLKHHNTRPLCLGCSCCRTFFNGALHSQLFGVWCGHLLKGCVLHTAPVLCAPGADKHMAIKAGLEVKNSFRGVEVDEGP